MYGTNITRISGMASGMDTESLVKKLMDAERIPVNKLKQKQQKMTWQSDAYRKWNTDMLAFRTKTLFDMKMSKTYGTFNTVSSKPEAVTAVATADAIPGTYKVKIDQLAEGATLTGSVQNGEMFVKKDQTITLDVNGNVGTIDLKKTDSIQDVVQKINGAKGGDGKNLGLQAIYDFTLNKFIMKTKDTGTGQSLQISSSDTDTATSLLDQLGLSSSQQRKVSTYTPGGASETKLSTSLVKESEGDQTIVVTLAGGTPGSKSITLKKGETVANLITKLNDEGIAASYNETTHKFTVFSDDPSVTDISLTTSSTTITSALGFGTDPATDPATKASSLKIAAIGKNAKVTFNGQSITSRTNSANLFGVNYTFKDAGSVEHSMTITRDLEAEIKNIKEFVDKYNELLENINTTINEVVYKDYQPLTEDERAALSEKQIEQWEEKAKSGLLRRDTTLSALANTIRLNMSSTVDNGSSYNSLAAIGITSSSYLDKGKLTVDEEKLRAALQDDPRAVENLFTQESDITEEDVKKDPTLQGKQGLIHRLYDNFGGAINELMEKAGVRGNPTNDESVLGKTLKDLDSRIYNMERRLIDRENRYYRQFAAMEKAMSQYNSQSSWLTQQLGGGN